MTTKIEVLDHGYATHIESWGSDEGIIEAARMSTDGGFVSWDPYEGHSSGDAGLLKYLYEHKHSTPFEMGGLTVEIQAPILVFRQWHRHRTQSYNEMSARYTSLPDMNYMPTVERCIVVNGSNKQARGSTERTPSHAEVLQWLGALQRSYDLSQEVYQAGLEIGIPKEVARCPVPVARYSRMRASANLRNWLAFLTLRMDPHAQEEIRVYANVVGSFIRKSFPRTWELFVEGQNGKR
jgi:thymidylate synthase (FAD)